MLHTLAQVGWVIDKKAVILQKRPVTDSAVVFESVLVHTIEHNIYIVGYMAMEYILIHYNTEQTATNSIL